MKDAVLVVKFELDDNIPSEHLTTIIEEMDRNLSSRGIEASYWAGVDDYARKVIDQTTLEK